MSKRELNERQKNILRYLMACGNAETHDIAEQCCDGKFRPNTKLGREKLIRGRADSSLECLKNRGLVRSWKNDMKRGCPTTWALSGAGRFLVKSGGIDD